ncbi:MAG: DUF6173 family protein [Terracidiphilus sp.]
MADNKNYPLPSIASLVPNIELPKIDFSTPKYMPLKTAEQVYLDNNMASEFHSRLCKWIEEYDKRLDDAHEVGVRLVSFGQSLTFHLQDIGYWNPSLMWFCGVMEDGAPVELIQHVTQISILLTKLPRLDPSIPKRSIGFCNTDENPDKCK